MSKKQSLKCQEDIDSSEEVLAIYDIRGIQNYIFRTNKVKEIIGASNIVQQLFEDILEEAVRLIKKERFEHSNNMLYLIKWRENQDYQFDRDKNIQMEVIYTGGGNTLILYRTNTLCRAVNRKLSRLILEKTYSLGLSVAVTKKTDQYIEDYQKLQKKLSEVKRQMAPTKLTGNFPVTRQEDSTGYPLSASYQETYKEKKKKRRSVSREVLYKLCYSSEEEVKAFDDMITEKGRESMLAVVHIDGNNMGMRIGQLMHEKGAGGYEEAVLCSRKISHCITEAFEGVYKKMKDLAKSWSMLPNCPLEPSRAYIRKIVSAGDDMTFVCNARLALSLTEYFLKEISKEVLYWEEGTVPDLDTYGLSACAGIAFFQSHFPFSDAYRVAEACCSNAKKSVKVLAAEGEHSVSVENGLDFQFCSAVSVVENLRKYRKKHYETADGTVLCMRPYIIPRIKENIVNLPKEYYFEYFVKLQLLIKDEKKVPVNAAKRLRNAYASGEYQTVLTAEQLRSRGIVIGESENKNEMYAEQNGKKIARYFDVLETMGFFTDIRKEEYNEAVDGDTAVQ